MKWFFIFLLLSTAVTAQTVADFPGIFLIRDFYLIKGDSREVPEIAAANTIAMYLPLSTYQKARITKRADDIEVLDRAAILVGTPCHNKWIQRVLNLQQCNIIDPSDGAVIVGDYNGLPVAIVTGGSPAAVLGAAQWLARGENRFYQSSFVKIAKAAGYQRVYVGSGYYIQNRNLLSIGQPISQVTPVIILGSQRLQGTKANAYLRPGDGKVIFGENRN
jgi:hypothetical protein